MNKTSIFFKSILLILKNATIILPLIEGIVNSIYQLKHPKESTDVTINDKTE